jgi:hypothetical protein
MRGPEKLAEAWSAYALADAVFLIFLIPGSCHKLVEGFQDKRKRRKIEIKFYKLF